LVEMMRVVTVGYPASCLAITESGSFNRILQGQYRVAAAEAEEPE